MTTQAAAIQTFGERIAGSRHPGSAYRTETALTEAYLTGNAVYAVLAFLLIAAAVTALERLRRPRQPPAARPRRQP